MTVDPDVFADARRVVAAACAGRRDAPGCSAAWPSGCAICPSALSPPLAQRTYRDLDFMGLAAESDRVSGVFEQLGFIAERRSNAINGHRRLMSRADTGARPTVDVLLDHFEMCHTFDFRDRLQLKPLTLPAADLLLTKLQVVEAEEKDLVDGLALLLGTRGRRHPGELDTAHIARLCAREWGLHATVERSLAKLEARADALDASAPPACARGHCRAPRADGQSSRSPRAGAPARASARGRSGMRSRRRWREPPSRAPRKHADVVAVLRERHARLGEVLLREIRAAEFYSVDALVLGGDLSGKVVVPVVAEPDGRDYDAHADGP